MTNSSNVVTLSCSITVSGTAVALNWRAGEDPAQSSPSVTCTSFAVPEGTYSLSLSYSDALGNDAAVTSVAGLSIDTVAQAPTLQSPLDNQVYTQNMQVAFTLAEIAPTGGVRLSFQRPNAGDVTLALTATAVGAFNFTLPVKALTSVSSDVSSVSPPTSTALEDGLYNISLRFRDRAGNEATAPQALNVLIDTRTLPITVQQPLNQSFTTVGEVLVRFTVPERQQADSLYLEVFSVTTNSTTLRVNFANVSPGQSVSLRLLEGQSPAGQAGVASVQPSSAVMQRGTFTLRIGYRDALGNPESVSLVESVAVDAAPVPQFFIPFNRPSLPASFPKDFAQLLALVTNSAVSRWRVDVPADRLSPTSVAPAQLSLLHLRRLMQTTRTVVTVYILPPVASGEASSQALASELDGELRNTNSDLYTTNASLVNGLESASVVRSIVCFGAENQALSCPTDDDSSNTAIIIIIAVVSGFVFLALVVIAVRYRNRQKKRLTSQDIEREFARADKNNDGVLTKEEYANMKRQDPDVEFVDVNPKNTLPADSSGGIAAAETGTDLAASNSEVALVNK
jgi:hypothetical protein